MDPSDPQWSDDAGMKKFDEFLVKYFPEGNRADNFIVTGCNVAQTLVQVLKQCGDDLTREDEQRIVIRPGNVVACNPELVGISSSIVESSTELPRY